MRSTLTKRGRGLIRGHDIAIRPKPLLPKPPPEPVPFELQAMSSWERQLYDALKKRDIAFTTQVTYQGGVGVLGGMKVDFQLLDRPVIIRIMGPWHNFPAAQARDALQEQWLLAQGWTVIDLWEQDLIDIDAALQAKLGIPVRTYGKQ